MYRKDQGDKKMEHNVFVYGTLRKSFWNHRLLRLSKFKGCYATKKHYKMTQNGCIPFVSKAVETPTNLHKLISMRTRYRPVVGEVYTVDSRTLQSLDYLEGHPQWYKREEIDIEGFGKAWCYLMTDDYTEGFKIARQTDERFYDWSYSHIVT